MTEVWTRFLIAAAVVVVCGAMIGTISGEIGDRLKLGRAWAGAVLLSLATSLPEMSTTFTAAFRGQASLAVGGIIGTILFNLLILVGVDVIDPEPIYPRVAVSHITTGLLGCALLGIITTSVAIGQTPISGSRWMGWGHVGVGSLGILALYGLAQYPLYQLARQQTNGEQPKAMKFASQLDRFSTKVLFAIYSGVAITILAAGYQLAVSAEKIASHYAIGATFAGATLLGIVTSLPEITNAIACARSRQVDLAVGNVLGANALVLVILALADIAETEERLFQSTPLSEAASIMTMAGFGIVMQAIVLLAISIRTPYKVWRMGIASSLVALLYIASLALTYFLPSLR